MTQKKGFLIFLSLKMSEPDFSYEVPPRGSTFVAFPVRVLAQFDNENKEICCQLLFSHFMPAIIGSPCKDRTQAQRPVPGMAAGGGRKKEGTVEGKRETDGVNGQKKTERKEFSVSQLLCRVYRDASRSTRTL